MDKGQELLEVLGEVIDRELLRMSDKIIEEDPDEYYIGYADYGTYDNGCGKASYGGEKVYDEDKAYEEAIERLAVDTANGGEDYELLCNEKILTAIAEFIRSR